jgi:hypothetical protein
MKFQWHSFDEREERVIGNQNKKPVEIENIIVIFFFKSNGFIQLSFKQFIEWNFLKKRSRGCSLTNSPNSNSKNELWWITNVFNVLNQSNMKISSNQIIKIMCMNDHWKRKFIFFTFDESHTMLRVIDFFLTFFYFLKTIHFYWIFVCVQF